MLTYIPITHPPLGGNEGGQLRWLLRWGSPLPIPNREVKPISADGTAVRWESMSPPSSIPIMKMVGIFLWYILRESHASGVIHSYACSYIAFGSYSQIVMDMSPPSLIPIMKMVGIFLFIIIIELIFCYNIK